MVSFRRPGYDLLGGESKVLNYCIIKLHFRTIMYSYKENIDLFNHYLLGENKMIIEADIFEGLSEGKKEWTNIQKILRSVISCFLGIASNQADII